MIDMRRLDVYWNDRKAGTLTELNPGKGYLFEYNNEYRERLTEAGLSVCGMSPDGTLVEAVEIPANRFHVGVQFHPEFKSRPDKAHPLFREFVRASLEAVTA